MEARLRSGWTCGTELLDLRIPRYSSRIYEIRNDGIVVQRRPCQSHRHDAAMWEWRIPPEVEIDFDDFGQGRIGGFI